MHDFYVHTHFGVNTMKHDCWIIWKDYLCKKCPKCLSNVCVISQFHQHGWECPLLQYLRVSDFYFSHFNKCVMISRFCFCPNGKWFLRNFPYAYLQFVYLLWLHHFSNVLFLFFNWVVNFFIELYKFLYILVWVLN